MTGRSPKFGLAAVELASPIVRPPRKHDSHKPQGKAKLGSGKEDGEGQEANSGGDEQIVS